MKNAKLLVFLLSIIILSISCNKESSDQGELEGIWFHSVRNLVWGGPNEPSFERGESHIAVTFTNEGEFIYKRIVLGIYEGTSISDTSFIAFESGIYTVENEKIDISLNQRLWWDAFYGNMDSLEHSGFDPKKFKDVTISFTDLELKLQYYVSTDLIGEEQETLGLDKFEEVYKRRLSK